MSRSRAATAGACTPAATTHTWCADFNMPCGVLSELTIGHSIGCARVCTRAGVRCWVGHFGWSVVTRRVWCASRRVQPSWSLMRLVDWNLPLSAAPLQAMLLGAAIIAEIARGRPTLFSHSGHPIYNTKSRVFFRPCIHPGHAARRSQAAEIARGRPTGRSALVVSAGRRGRRRGAADGGSRGIGWRLCGVWAAR